MSPREQSVATCSERFCRSDHERIPGCLTCLTDDVVWDLAGKDAFDGEIENDPFVGSPALIVDCLVEEADSVVVIGNGEVSHNKW